MRFPRPVLLALLALGVAGIVFAQAPPEKPAPPVPAKEEGAPPGLAKGATLPPGLAKRLGEELPDVVWIGFHPSRDDGAWVLLDLEWTLITGLPPAARDEVKEARKRPSQTPPVPPPTVGVPLHVVRFERP
jgi:hypothetical protein